MDGLLPCTIAHGKPFTKILILIPEAICHLVESVWKTHLISKCAIGCHLDLEKDTPPNTSS